MQKARVTSTDVRAPAASRATSSVAERSVMASSSGVNQPEAAGHPVTSSCDAGGSRFGGTTHSRGIDARSAARFRAPISCHVSPSAGLGVPDELVVVPVGNGGVVFGAGWLVAVATGPSWSIVMLLVVYSLERIYGCK